MTSRLYSEDITASGFVLGDTVKSKGDVEAAAGVHGVTVVASGEIRGANLIIENKVETLIAEVGGTLTAGGVETKKVTAQESITVGDINVGASIMAMSSKIEDMQAVINKLVGIIEASGGGSGTGGGSGRVGEAAAVEGQDVE